MTFEDQDVIRRSNSVDFTLPRWATASLGIGAEPTRIAVPIALFHKGSLVHFNLSDESSQAVPLLSGTQAGQLAEMALVATAELALQSNKLPDEIVKDIHLMACNRKRPPSETGERTPSQDFQKLFSTDQPHAENRKDLQSHPIFLPMAEAFDDNFIAAVLLTVAAGDRRVIHFAYDEEISEPDELIDRLETTIDMFVGRISRRVLVMASAAGEAASFHIEAEAPEGLRISSRVTFTRNKDEPIGQVVKQASRQRKLLWWRKMEPPVEQPTQVVETLERKGSYRRAHIHCVGVPANAEMAVVLRIGPRSSTIVRGATLTSALTMLAVLYVRLRLPALVEKDATGIAAVLLVIPTVLSIWVARSEEHPATTYLLWPLRIVATTPSVLGLAAAGVVVTGGNTFWSKLTLDVLIVMLAVATWILGATWHGALRRHGRRRLLPERKAKATTATSDPSDSLQRPSRGEVQP